MSLLELGPSAGLLLLLDRYRYRYADATWGPEDAPLELEGGAPRVLPAACSTRRSTSQRAPASTGTPST